MEHYTPINLTYYNPNNSIFKAGKSDRERYSLYSCCNTENCDAYKNGKCLMLNGLWGQRCPYGQKHAEEGYTKASRKCGNLIRKIKEQYNDVSYALKPLEYPCYIGDYVYLSLPYLSNYENSIRPKGFFFSDGLIHKDNFTSEFVAELIKYKPRALMGGVISEYQAKYLPAFVRHFRQRMPEKYAEVRAIYPEIDEIGTLTNMNFVGKRAMVKTLLPCKVGLCGHVHVAEWDGIVIKTKGRELGWRLSGDEVVIINPTDNTFVEVMDNNSVTEDTIFEE